MRTLVSGARDKNASALYIASSPLLVCYSKNEVHSLDIASPECLRHIQRLIDQPNETSGRNSIPVFFNTPRFVIPYRFFDTGAVSSISL